MSGLGWVGVWFEGVGDLGVGGCLVWGRVTGLGSGVVVWSEADAPIRKELRKETPHMKEFRRQAPLLTDIRM